MSIKKKLAMGIATGALAVSMIGGGTYAYFSDVETSVNTFAAGTLDLALSPQEIINVDNIKPGDRMNKTFTLKNEGSLDIAKVLLNTDYEVINKVGEPVNIGNLADNIRVNLMWNITAGEMPVVWTTLAELKEMTPEAIATKYWGPFEMSGGLKPNKSNVLNVTFEFINKDEPQNEFQGDSLILTWDFDARQGNGKLVQ